MSSPSQPDPLLAEQISYYRAVADEYEDHAIPRAADDEVAAALDAFRPAGDILELACGPGIWTERLLRHATSLTAVDAAPEMLARARARVDSPLVRFVQADLFGWRPDRRYDVVFFGFWISHVPVDRFEAFWAFLAGCLQPGGRVFFCDDNYRPPEELIEGESSPIVLRRLNDGTGFRAVKVPYRADELEKALQRLGWRITVTQTSSPIYWGAGAPAS